MDLISALLVDLPFTSRHLSCVVFGYDIKLRYPAKGQRMAIPAGNSFGTRDKLSVGAQSFEIHRLELLEKHGIHAVAKLPFSLRILLENLLRCEDGRFVRPNEIRALAGWTPNAAQKEIAFMPARVLLQDFTGVPAVVDLATMREAVKRMGGNPS